MGKTNSQSAKQTLLGLILLLVLIAGVGKVLFMVLEKVPELLSKFSALDTAIIVALITGTISTITYVVGNIVNNVMEKNSYLREKRKEPYYRLISMFYDVQAAHKEERDMTQKELVEILNTFSKELTLWGSSKAINLWGKWRVQVGEGEASPEQTLFGMEEVMIQLRRDMGMRRGVKRGDLLRLFINNIDEFI
ncbi:hypothetical protein [Arcanobacterium pinnipediorum]|uniref:Uncharacterized protein n=1 Tax=Arcanobacterium pinnipediorum TaxID=1503041 RepID=A0ABY5AFR4_9ACTO|nr:hypothetical protein [Arcanobacterium pinnipediorum]USR79025.1 hypothetical protein NG665_06440 [Arcanobacterium pinnipediorum]